MKTYFEKWTADLQWHTGTGPLLLEILGQRPQTVFGPQLPVASEGMATLNPTDASERVLLDRVRGNWFLPLQLDVYPEISPTPLLIVWLWRRY